MIYFPTELLGPIALNNYYSAFLYIKDESEAQLYDEDTDIRILVTGVDIPDGDEEMVVKLSNFLCAKKPDQEYYDYVKDRIKSLYGRDYINRLEDKEFIKVSNYILMAFEGDLDTEDHINGANKLNDYIRDNGYNLFEIVWDDVTRANINTCKISGDNTYCSYVFLTKKQLVKKLNCSFNVEYCEKQYYILKDNKLEKPNDFSSLPHYDEDTNRWNITIDVETGTVEEWPAVHIKTGFKVRDEAKITYLNETGDILLDEEIYVPNYLEIDDSDGSDIIFITIQTDGKILNWNKELVGAYLSKKVKYVS